MSAFFIQPGCLDDVVAMACRDTDTAKQRTELGRHLYAMNRDAMCQRYGDDPADYDPQIAAYEWQEPATSPAQQLKSLNCWLYQCAEGDVDDRPMYRLLDAVSDSATDLLAAGRTKLVFGENRPFVAGYDDAQWDRSR